MADLRTLHFALSRRNLYDIIRITAAQRPFRRVALPALAGFVFLGHAVDGNYVKGLVWAVTVGALYWGVSQLMFWLNVYGPANETLLVPQEITLHDDRMVVSSEHGEEEFERPLPSDVKAGDKHLILTTETGKLVFLKRSFEAPEDFQTLKNWLKSGF